MKKIILTASIIALAATATNAQITVGAKAGLNLATFTGADATRTNLPGKSNKAGLNVGAIVNIPISSGISVEPGASLSMEGCKVDGGTYDLVYINVPVMAKYKFPHTKGNKDAGFSIASGPQVGYLVSANVKPTGGVNTDIKDQLKSFDYSWAVALSYMTAKRFGIEAKYNIGVITIDKDDPKQKITNSVLQFNLFYIFAKKGKAKKGK